MPQAKQAATAGQAKAIRYAPANIEEMAIVTQHHAKHVDISAIDTARFDSANASTATAITVIKGTAMSDPAATLELIPLATGPHKRTAEGRTKSPIAIDTANST